MPEQVTTTQPQSQQQGPSQSPAPLAAPAGNGAHLAAPPVSGRSPGLILLVAAFALFLISIQSISEVSELLFQHVDDSFLEDGAFFASIDVSGEDMHSLNDYDEQQEHTEESGRLSTNGTAAVSSTRPAPAPDKDEVLVWKLRVVDLQDQYGLFRAHFTAEELAKVFDSCAKIWLAQANIQLDLTHVRVQLDAAEDDAHRWLLYGTKDQRKPAFWKDVSQYLRKGAAKMGAKQTGEVIARYLQASGYPLMDWITQKAQTLGTEPTLTVVPLAYWPWNNGGTLGKRVFVRTGSCSTPPVSVSTITEKPKRLSRKKVVEEPPVLCNGWPSAAVAQSKPSLAEASRALAHLLGTQLGLRRLGGDRCILTKTSSSPLGLMCVPSAEAKGSADFYVKAVHLTAQERLQARSGVTRFSTSS